MTTLQLCGCDCDCDILFFWRVFIHSFITMHGIAQILKEAANRDTQEEGPACQIFFFNNNNNYTTTLGRMASGFSFWAGYKHTDRSKHGII